MVVKKKNNTPWYAMGLHFECMQCGGCCSGPDEGYIWLTKPEIKLIADFLKITEGQLRKKYIERVGMRTTILEHAGTKDCIFLRNDGRKGCTIYPVRPNQCRTWPFWASNLTSSNSWNRAAQNCPGVNRGRAYDVAQVKKIKAAKKWWQEQD